MTGMKALLASCALLLGVAMPASAQPADAEATIRATLAAWTHDFNARDASRICDLFARALRYNYRGFPERGYDALCDLLHRSLADPAKQFVYALDLKEVIVSGDLAVVRLVWTLKTTVGRVTTPIESKEPGLDVFRRQPD
jgi:ketosteroid isomerase-like protein